MAKVTVFLVRCGETELEHSLAPQTAEAVPEPEKGEDEEELVIDDTEYGTERGNENDGDGSEEEENEVSDGSQEEEEEKEEEENIEEASIPSEELGSLGSKEDASLEEEDMDDRPLRLCQKVDPFLTREGYQLSQYALTCLIQGIADSTEEERRLAAFSAPLKSCVGTSFMLSCSRLGLHTNLRWQLTTADAIRAPCAVPVIIHNALCTAEPEIEQCGGYKPVVDAGLLHCAAAHWNDTRLKCPMSLVMKKVKATTKEHVTTWKEDNEGDPEDKKRRVLDMQFFRVEQAGNPWSLQALIGKTNILIDLIDPARYMTPPRKGSLAPKRQGIIKRPGAAVAVQESVWWARQTGCDAAIFMVGEAAMKELARAAGLLGEEDDLEIPPCSVATLIASVPDEANHESVEFQFHGFYTVEELMEDPTAAVPEFTGQNDVRMPAPPDNDPMAVPVNQWSKFKAPPPENIPDDYPDLPPFCEALTAPVPKRHTYVGPQGGRGGPGRAGPPPPGRGRGRGPPPGGRGRGRGRAGPRMAGRAPGRGPPVPGRGRDGPRPVGRAPGRGPPPPQSPPSN